MINIYSVLVYFCICIFGQACLKEYDDTGSLITKKHYFIASVLAPDSSSLFSRSYPIEVFCGYILPAPKNNIYFVNGVSDPVLHQLLYDTRQHYRIYYEFDSTATIYLSDDKDSVKLMYYGYGVYRLPLNGISIKTGKTYHINVISEEGKKYYSETKIPDLIYISNPDTNIDTIKVIPQLYGPTWIGLVPINISYSHKPEYFSKYDLRSNFEPITSFSVSGFDFQQGVFFQASAIDTNRLSNILTKITIRGYDSNFALFNQPTNFTAGDDFWNSYYHKLEDLPITKRSNIKGSRDITGVFGSFSADMRSYVVSALWQNVVINQNK